jgi:hypothetical protein
MANPLDDRGDRDDDQWGDEPWDPEEKEYSEPPDDYEQSWEDSYDALDLEDYDFRGDW